MLPNSFIQSAKRCKSSLPQFVPQRNGDPGRYDGYHLVISHSRGKSPFLIGKPSISIRAIYTMAAMAMLNNQRVYYTISI